MRALTNGRVTNVNPSSVSFLIDNARVSNFLEARKYRRSENLFDRDFSTEEGEDVIDDAFLAGKTVCSIDSTLSIFMRFGVVFQCCRQIETGVLYTDFICYLLKLNDLF